MKVFISADIEGITGLVAWSQCGGPGGDCYDYEFARRMMTHDVNAAVRGARAAGADQVVVKDSHGNSKNLLIDNLPAGVELISGFGALTDGMMIGVDSTFDCAVLVGYHAMAGTAGAIMEHTISGSVHGFWINGVRSGEIAMSAATAGQYGVPLVAVTSDLAGCKEAEGLIAGVKTAAVKEGFGRYMGKLLHPEQTAPLIENAVKEGVLAARTIKPHRPAEPVTIRLEQNRGEEADMVAKLPNWKRLDDFTLECTAKSWPEAHSAAWQAFGNASMGGGANR